ncbi:phosphatidylserine decarboxylase [Rhexocercosporidium sp. MPI-PUGE-AT-0058]|nr:phosphatidylserine decarboxylase [Rhexocercosporidium sp. MPI-PUGE-AT-0058]
MASTAPPGPIDRSTNAPSILAVNGVFFGFTILVMAARIYVRAVMLKTMGTDDWLILAATLCGAGVFACFIGETHNGKGMHTASIRPDELIRMFHWNFFHSIIVTVGISLVKLSVGFFLLRLATGKAHKIFLYCILVFLVAFTLTSAGTILFSCIPIRASWDRMSEPGAKCFSFNTFTNIGLFNSIVNILTDVLFASLPIPIVWKLQVNMRTKISLICILSLGYFACVCSIVKTTIQVHVFENPDATRHDKYTIWNALELYVGLLAASLPALRPLFKSMLDLRTRATSSSNPQRHKYYMQEDGIGMNSLPGQGTRASKYNVKVTTRSQPSRNHLGRSTQNTQSEDDFTSKGDADSLDDILPMQGRQGGITKTVNVSVT